MAKRKTKKKDTTNTVSKIAYEGKVKVQFLHGNKAYKTFESKNRGTKYMFSFLADCLAGNFYDSQRPFYLRLYKVTLDEYGAESGTVDEREEITTSAIPARSINSVSEETQSTVTYDFLIPAVSLSVGEANMLTLFSFDGKNNKSKNSAEVLLETPIEKEDGTTNIKVEWTLIIGNKVEE